MSSDSASSRAPASDSPICWPRMRSTRTSACSAPSVGRALQGRGGQLPQRVGGELRVDPLRCRCAGCTVIHGRPTYPDPGRPGLARYARHDRTAVARELRRSGTQWARSVLVTGGNRGIGLAIARRLAAGGDAVAVTSRSGDARRRADRAPCDVTRRRGGRCGVHRGRGARTGRSRCWWPTPASPATSCCCAMSEDDFAAVLDTNLAGAFRVAKRAVAADAPAAPRPDHLHLVGGRPARLGRAGQLRRVEGGPGRPGPLARPRARRAGASRRTSSRRASSTPT